MGGFPPLSLSSGPAVSGAPNTGGVGGTGAFYSGSTQNTWQNQLATLAPLAILGLGLWLIMRA